MVGPGDLELPFHQTTAPTFLNASRDLVGHRRRRSALLLGVSKGPHALKARPRDERLKFAECLRRLPGEADDEGRPQRQPWDAGAQLDDERFELCAAAAAIHRLQDACVAVL